MAATEVNVQLGELTLNQHHMTLLDPAVATHPDLEEALGVAASNYQSAELQVTPRPLPPSHPPSAPHLFARAGRTPYASLPP